MNKITAAILTFFAFSQPSFAQVSAMPNYQNLGSVRKPSQRSTTITFMNMSGQPIYNFSTFCSGDSQEFNCNSSCFSLAPYGSCSVWVYFTPQLGDGQLKTLTVQAIGSGVFAQAQILAVDEKIDP